MVQQNAYSTFMYWPSFVSSTVWILFICDKCDLCRWSTSPYKSSFPSAKLVNLIAVSMHLENPMDSTYFSCLHRVRMSHCLTYTENSKANSHRLIILVQVQLTTGLCTKVQPNWVWTQDLWIMNRTFYAPLMFVPTTEPSGTLPFISLYLSHPQLSIVIEVIKHFIMLQRNNEELQQGIEFTLILTTYIGLNIFYSWWEGLGVA